MLANAATGSSKNIVPNLLMARSKRCCGKQWTCALAARCVGGSPVVPDRPFPRTVAEISGLGAGLMVGLLLRKPLANPRSQRRRSNYLDQEASHSDPSAILMKGREL